MMAKLRKGGDFRGCVNYVTRAKKDNPDGSPCDEWRLIDAEGVATYGGREEIIASFEDNQALNPKLKNVVGHFSLNFHVNDAWNYKGIYTFEQFGNRLKAAGVGVKFKYRRGTNQVQGLWFTRKGKKFPASKIDRKFSFANLSKHLSKNTPLHPKSEFMFIDGTIRPINKLLGVRLTAQQVNDYVSGKTIRLDSYTGNHPTVFVKFDRTAMRPCSYLSNPDNPKQAAPSNSVSAGHSVQPSSPQEDYSESFFFGIGCTATFEARTSGIEIVANSQR